MKMSDQKRQRIFENQYNHIEGDRCELCGLPAMTPPYNQIVYGCSGCGRSFIILDGKRTTIEKFLDPENILQLENLEGFSPQFQLILEEQTKMRKMADPVAQLGMIPNFLGAFRPWADHAFKLMSGGLGEEALFAFVLACHDHYTNAGFWLNIAQITANFELFDIAERAIFIAKKVEPNYEALPRIIQRVHAFKKRSDSVFQNMKQNERKSHNLVKMGFVSYQSGLTQRGINRIKQAIQMDENNAAAWTNLGSLYLPQGENQLAAEAFQRALNLDPSNPTVVYNMMNFYVLRNDYSTAIKMVEKAVELDPHNPRFQQKLAQLRNLHK